jgi:hypothetical protein
MNIEAVKNEVKSHRIVPFRTGDITCGSDKSKQVVHIKDNFVPNIGRVMTNLGIRNNLVKDIFNKPNENWKALQHALDSIDKDKQFSCIVNRDNIVVDIIKSRVSEETQLNFDDRIDQVVDAMESEDKFKFHNILFDAQHCNVRVDAISRENIELGGGDDWKFGTSVTISNIANAVSEYYNRLICSNGMVTRENLSYRTFTGKDRIGQQFSRYIKNINFVESIKPRVDRLKKNRASLYEMNMVANALTKAQTTQLFPQYDHVVECFRDRGYDVNEFSAKRSRLVYTDQNLYDVFNVATALASHNANDIGRVAANELNKAAGEIFVKGPVLEMSVLDIFHS